MLPYPFNLNKISTPIHPYLLGILLGDGCFKLSTPTLTCFDEEIIKRIESFGYKVQKRSVDGCYSFLQDTGIAQALKDLNLTSGGQDIQYTISNHEIIANRNDGNDNYNEEVFRLTLKDFDSTSYIVGTNLNKSSPNLITLL